MGADSVTYKYKTKIGLTLLGLAFDKQVPIEIEYTVRKGCEATREQPAEGPTLELVKITLTDSKGTRYRAHDWLWELFEGDDELQGELLSEAAAADESGRDLRDALRGEAYL
jgi:hypothetical protein